MILIPAIDIKGGRCVRLVQGAMDSETVFSEDPVAMAQQWESQGAERLHLVDLDGAVSGATVHYDLIERIIKAVKIPVQVGGGIREPQSDRALSLGRGVRLRDPGHGGGAERAALGEGGDAEISASDHRRDRFHEGKVAVRGWTEVHPEEACRRWRFGWSEAGVAAMILTDIDNDGMLAGVNVDGVFREIGVQVDIPVIASGGVTTLPQIQQLAEIPGVEGVAIVGKALYDRGPLDFRTPWRCSGEKKPDMLAKRIIPCLDVDRGRVVKGVRFEGLRDAGDPVESARRYSEAGRRRTRVPRHHGQFRRPRRDAARMVRRRSPSRCSSRSPSAAACAAWRTSAACWWRAPTRCRSTPPPCSARNWSSGGGAGVRQPVHRGRHRRQAQGARSLGSVHPRRAERETGLDAVEWAQRMVALGCRRAAADQHGPRRHAARASTWRSRAR
ncbi:MAG: HisA/HisF-related TIM barrel protein [Candidatus Manganitrophus sp.]|nr:MAG: HisA/HisF-related TIM barrel protein [Candidatus Manganitrophus sp.]